MSCCPTIWPKFLIGLISGGKTLHSCPSVGKQIPIPLGAKQVSLTSEWMRLTRLGLWQDKARFVHQQAATHCASLPLSGRNMVYCCQVFLESSSGSDIFFFSRKNKISWVLNVVNLFEFLKHYVGQHFSGQTEQVCGLNLAHSQWVLELSRSSSWELILSIFSRLYKLQPHVGSWNSFMVRVLTPQKLANGINLDSSFPVPLLSATDPKTVVKPQIPLW